GYGGMGGGGMGGPGGHRRGGDSLVADVDESDTVSRKGIKASSGLSVSGGVFNIDSADDSVHSNADCDIFGGSFTVASGDDGFHADGTLTVADGNIDISTSYEGLEGLHIKISGGDITLVSDDDGLNAAGGNDESGYGGFFGGDGFGGRGPGGHGGTSAGEGSILISGGRLYVNASGDGIDANGTLEIRGGHTTVCGPTVGDTATLDYDLSATISGGTFIGTGGAGMAQTFSESSQGVIALSVGERAAKTRVQILTKDGKELISVSPELSFAVVILSCPEMEKGESYTVRVGDNEDSFEAQ
ncbi:MAG: carbohydrate-binding domain-containing protein, partial [Clostridia bacterium]|nr:carbohydrate-binding domain-containing protein [Clostridia bacterium]